LPPKNPNAHSAAQSLPSALKDEVASSIVSVKAGFFTDVPVPARGVDAPCSPGAVPGEAIFR